MTTFWLAILLGLILPVQHPEMSLSGHEERSRELGELFMKSLKNELVGAMTEGGPVNAIIVCRERAAAIAGELTATSGYEISRTSLKVRNPDNRPDAWETDILTEFEQRLVRGESFENLEVSRLVEDEKGTYYRYMKAIPMKGFCTRCHGQSMDASVSETLARYYPADTAVGYQTGEIRGALTIQKKIEPTKETGVR